jgi:hypothetical protein
VLISGQRVYILFRDGKEVAKKKDNVQVSIEGKWEPLP